ncbi:hypothetical protein M408DRAFT_76772 [Serendipita vermifera MAFF 305830]|uniref:Histone-lysine N-methyltransferase SET5 n=1 Tax=Serendipita vermifera MAFF 305830 TaxID=933852 RepID=A0A0C2X3C8_SERVB|nr:hypothetical protein M408DRAFT_76772 [Serendipita vermifera MAFF 305830]
MSATLSIGTISPSEEDLTTQLKLLRDSHPTTGVAKLLALLKDEKPEWTVSEKRAKKVLQQAGLMISATLEGKKSAKAGATGAKPRKYPVSSMDSKVDAKKWTEKVSIRHFDAVKGKGLVATEHIEEGETIWKEDPWIMTANWSVYSGSVSGNVCMHCSCPLSLRNAGAIFTCTGCTSPTNQYCNRLCYSRAQASYHPFLCEGQNPACIPLLKLLRRHEWASPHALARVTGRLLTAWRNRESDWEGDWAFFTALAGWTMDDKYHSEGYVSSSILCAYSNSAHREEITSDMKNLWKKAFEHYVEAFHQPPTAEGRNKLQHLMKRKSLPAEIVSKLFTYDAFMLNVGRVDVNRESHGGVYQLHSHVNHSCTPNVSVLHIDVPGTQGRPPNAPSFTGTPNPSRLTIWAKRPITPGEELTASYVSPLLGVKERRRELRQWGIENCQCERCMKEEKEIVNETGDAQKPELEDLEGELRRSFGLGF